MAVDPIGAYIALGANLGDPVQALADACTAIAALPHTRITQRSSLYRSAPVEATGPDYVNAVIHISTQLPLYKLLEQLQNLEQLAGRDRSNGALHNAPRTLDLDILLYGDTTLNSPTLTVPHPRMRQRAFVLLPLAEIAPAWAALARTPAIAGQRIERLAPKYLGW